MGSWISECRKLWKNRMIFGLLLSCFLLNIAFFCQHARSYDQTDRCFPGTVKEIYEEIAAFSEQEKIAWLEEELQDIEEQMKTGASEDMENTDHAERKNALSYVLKNVQKIAGYEDHLNEIEERAGQMAISVLFSQTDLFSRRNAGQIVQKYRRLHGISLKAEDPQGVLLATGSGTTDLFLTALIVLLAYFFICMERENGAMAFARCTRYGGRALGRTKIAVIFAGSLLGTILLYMSNLIIAGALYGYGSMERGIQSIEGYTESPWKLSVGGYLVLFLAGKLLAAAALTAVVIWIALHGKDILSTSIALLLVAAVGYAFYFLIPLHSRLDILKQCNLFSFIKTERFFQDYRTIDLFQYPVSSALVCGIAAAALTAALVLHSVISYERVSQGEYARRSRKRSSSGRKRRRKEYPLFCHEAYKILWTGRAGALILLFLLFQFRSFSGETVWPTTDELYYKNYIRQLEGSVTKEKLDLINKEGERIEKLRTELFSLSADADDLSGSELQARQLTLEQQLLCQTAYEQVKSQAERIGPDGVFLDETGYAYLLDWKEQAVQTERLLFLFILAFYPVFIIEEASGMSTIWNSIPNGKKKIWRRKWALLIGSILLVCIASELMLILFRMKAQGLTQLNVPIRYLPGAEGWKHLSVLGYLTGACLLKVLFGILVCKLIEVISKKAGSAATVLLSAGGIIGMFCLVLHRIW